MRWRGWRCSCSGLPVFLFIFAAVLFATLVDAPVKLLSQFLHVHRVTTRGRVISMVDTPLADFGAD
jgi:hypothetical protein